MGEAKRRGTFEQRKNSALERFNKNTDEVINKMIEFGIYEKSLENENSLLVHGNYLFSWVNGKYAYAYIDDPAEMNQLAARLNFLKSQENSNHRNFKGIGNSNSTSFISDFEITSDSPEFSKMITDAFGDDQEIIKNY